MLSFYVESTKAAPKSVSVRAYGTKSGVTGWHNFNATHNYTGPYGTINSLISVYNGNIYNIRCWEITIEADDNLPCYVCEIMNIFTRSNGEVDQSVVTKYANAQTLYGAITIDNSISTTGKATLDSLEVTNASTLKGATTVSGAATLNGGATIKGTGNAVTNINGASASVDYSHIFVTGGSNNTRPLVLQNGYGNVGIGVTAPTQKLEVDGNVKAASFIKSGGTSSQFLKADGSVDSNTYALASAIPTVDATPTASSTNAVSSGGVYAELTDVVHEGDRIGSESYVDSGSVVTDLSGYATKAWVEAKGYLTQETDPGVYAWAKAATKPTYTASEVGALPSSTVIPTRLTQLTNDAGFIAGYTETDPVFVASPAHGITAADITKLRALPTFYSGTSAPASSLGSDGDIYLQTS